MSMKINKNGALMNSVFSSVNNKTFVEVSQSKKYCGGLNGDKAIQCLTLQVSNDIASISFLAAKRIREEANTVSTKIKAVSINNADIVMKYNYSFTVSFLQVYDKLVLSVKSCSKFEAIKRLDCLINLGANNIKNTGDSAAKNVLKTADNTAKQVTKLNKVIKTISGFEDLSRKIKKATGDMLEKATSVSKNIKVVGKNTANAIKQAAGIKNTFLELVVKENALQCQGLTGIALMNCLSNNAAKKMKAIGIMVARDFLNEANNIANKISTLGRDVAKHIRKEFSRLNKKHLLKKILVSTNAEYSKSLVGCQKLLGIPRIKCIITRGASEIHRSGRINSKAIEKVSRQSTSVIYNVANKMKKISGFEIYAGNARTAAIIMQTRGKSLAKIILKSCRTAEIDIQFVSGL